MNQKPLAKNPFGMAVASIVVVLVAEVEFALDEDSPAVFCSNREPSTVSRQNWLLKIDQ